MAPSLSNGFKTRSQGRAKTKDGLSVDRRHASRALPSKSFEPIGRHARIYALPDWIVGHADSGRDWNPTPCSEVSDPYRSRARHGVSYSSSTVIKSPSHGGPSGPYRDLEIA